MNKSDFSLVKQNETSPSIQKLIFKLLPEGNQLNMYQRAAMPAQFVSSLSRWGQSYKTVLTLKHSNKGLTII